MKLIHFSDTHLGFSDLDVINSDAINQREADFYKAFSDVIDSIILQKPDFAIHTGDLFHRASPSNRAITTALSELKRLEKAKIPLIIISGNHSTPRTATSSPILRALETLENVYAVFSQRYEKISFKKIIFHALPHINDERIIEDELEKIEASVDHKKRNVLLMHCSVGAHYLMHEFGEWVFPKAKENLFAMMDYVALGHWHGFSQVGKYPNVYYAGSTERTSSNDKRNNKGYVRVELKDKTTVTHCSISIRPSLLFEIDANDFEEEVKKLDLTNIKNALVEIKLHNLTPATTIDITNHTLREIFKDALYVKIKRFFQTNHSEQIEGNLKTISLQDYFIEHIKENIKNKTQQKRLSNKARKLFAECDEAIDDTH